MVYGNTFLPNEYKSNCKDNDITLESISVIYNEYVNRLSLLESCTDDSEKQILESQIQVLYEISFQDIKNKIHDIIEFIKKKWREFKDWVKKIWNKIFHNEEEAKKEADKVEKMFENMFKDEDGDSTIMSTKASKSARTADALKNFKFPVYSIKFKNDKKEILVSGGDALYALKTSLDGDIKLNDGSFHDYNLSNIDKDIKIIEDACNEFKSKKYDFENREIALRIHSMAKAQNRLYDTDTDVNRLEVSNLESFKIKNYTMEYFTIAQNNDQLFKSNLNKIKADLHNFDENDASRIRGLIDDIFDYQGKFEKDIDDLNNYNKEFQTRINRLDKCVKDLDTIERNLVSLFNQTNKKLKDDAEKYAKDITDNRAHVQKAFGTYDVKSHYKRKKLEYKDYMDNQGHGYGFREYEKGFDYYDTFDIRGAIKELHILSNKIQGTISNLRRISSSIMKAKNESITAVKMLSARMIRLCNAEAKLDRDPNEI